MGQKDGSQMRVPFGLDAHGNAVWADQIPYDRNGFKCGLVCPDPNCGKRLKAVRWSKDDPERGIHYRTLMMAGMMNTVMIYPGG